MIVLNKNNGDLSIGDFRLTSKTSTVDINTLCQQYVLQKVLQNAQFDTYSITNIDEGESALFLIFENRILKTINITTGYKYSFSPFIEESQQMR